MIVALIQLPPPIHGAAMRNKEFLEFLQKNVSVSYLDLAPKQAISGIGKFRVRKVLQGLATVTAAVQNMWKYRSSSSAVYITPAQGGWGLVRDATLAWMGSRILGLRVVCHFRAVGLAECPNTLKGMLRRAFRRCYAIAMSPKVSLDLAGTFSEDRVTVVPNGLAQHAPRLREERDDSEFRVLHVSNLSEGKGTFDALRAFAMLRSRVPHARLIVIGSWACATEESRFDDELQTLGLEDAVSMRGALYGEEKWKEFCSSDVFVFPSTYAKECFPGVVLEAMSAGLPTVAYDHAAVPDMLCSGRTGYVVKRHDVEAVAASLEMLAGNSTLRASISSSAHAEFYAKYRACVTHPQLLQAIRDTCV